jgi:hypothetical protein
LSLVTVVSDTTKLAARVVGIPRPNMASEHRNSLIDDLRTALPSPLLENGVSPDPLRFRSISSPFFESISPSEIALPSPNCPEKAPN